MQNSLYPLVIYGIGGYADGVIKFLEQYNIKIDAAVIDKEYLNKDSKFWRGIPVLPIEDANAKLDSFNIVIGFSDFKKAEYKLKTMKGCKETFFLDSTLSLDFFDYTYVSQNIDSFQRTFDLFNEDLSKETFIAYINAKISGRPDDLYELVDFNQYFPEGIIKLSDHEVFVDAGAYNGDTILKFLKQANGHYKRIYAFEPDTDSFELLCNTIKNQNLNNVELVKKGAWKDNQTIKFNMDSDMGSRSAISEQGDFFIEVDSIDNIVEKNEATFIKMDIEGAELTALYGAEQTIIKSKPKLAICVYHKPEDLLVIPQYLNRIVPEYKFFLRHHLFITHELVLYAVIE